MTYCILHEPKRQALGMLHRAIKTPPFSKSARLEAGLLLRRLQRGDKITLPHSKPMPVIGTGCHELRINDADMTWRIMYRLETDAVVILDIFEKKTARTPKKVIDLCKNRLKRYNRESK
ncbi:MAG: type II toxin-antitoxin system RelE/ParE family toxin [Pseudomonadales bacterium]|nr:type II toxin-antitoxin system RelE/ParE family toxin [Pseudomonadales bacterium]